jgi:uncharacterized protein (TIRG00374 family)
MTAVASQEAYSGSLKGRIAPVVRQRISLVLKIAVSTGILLALVMRFQNDVPSLAVIDRWTIAGAIGLLLIQPVLIGLRWRLLLRQYDSRSTFPMLTAVSWVAVFANQFLPAGVGGDAVRIIYARHLGDRLSAATASVIMDRVMALVALVLLVIVLTPFLPEAVDRRIIGALGALCFLCLTLVISAYLIVSRSWEVPVRIPMVQRLLTLVHYVLRTLSYPVQALFAIAVSVLIHLLSFSAFVLIARSIGITTAIEPLVAVTALLTFIQIVPISIGGWGVREVAAVSLLGFLGVEPGAALLSSLVLGFSYAAASLPGAALWPFVRARTDRPLKPPNAPVR